MKRLDLILNGKGGVGKSFFAVNFVQFLKDKGIAHVAIDSDNENSTLKRFHPEVGFIDLAQPRSLDEMFRGLEKGSLVVVDCHAGLTGGSLTSSRHPLFSRLASQMTISDTLAR